MVHAGCIHLAGQAYQFQIQNIQITIEYFRKQTVQLRGLDIPRKQVSESTLISLLIKKKKPHFGMPECRGRGANVHLYRVCQMFLTLDFK